MSLAGVPRDGGPRSRPRSRYFPRWLVAAALNPAIFPEMASEESFVPAHRQISSTTTAALAALVVTSTAAASGLPEYLALRLTLFKFGVHCDHGNTFDVGLRAFSVGALKRSYGPPPPPPSGLSLSRLGASGGGAAARRPPR